VITVIAALREASGGLLRKTTPLRDEYFRKAGGGSPQKIGRCGPGRAGRWCVPGPGGHRTSGLPIRQRLDTSS
jgi:hypothetical protein